MTGINGRYRSLMTPAGPGIQFLLFRPAICAVFRPTVIDMSRLGASARLMCVGGNHGDVVSPVIESREDSTGGFDEDWIPPATIRRSIPRRFGRPRCL